MKAPHLPPQVHTSLDLLIPQSFAAALYLTRNRWRLGLSAPGLASEGYNQHKFRKPQTLCFGTL